MLGLLAELEGWASPTATPGLVRQAAEVLRAAAVVANVYASRLEVAQARWRQVRGGAIVGRGRPQAAGAAGPRHPAGGGCGGGADAEARAAAVALAAELQRLADQLPT